MRPAGQRIFWAIECLAVVASILWAFFDPTAGGRVYAVLAISAVAGFVVFQFLWNPGQLPRDAENTAFQNDELKVLRKYNFWFKFPSLSITMCSIASLLQMTAMVMVPWFLYQSQWLPAIAGILAFAIGPFFRHRFDPRNYLNMLATKRPDMFTDDLEVMDRTIAKVLDQAETALAQQMAKVLKPKVDPDARKNGAHGSL